MISTRSSNLNCYFCKFITNLRDNLHKHLIDAHAELIFCCKHCNYYLPREELMPHMTKHAQEVEEEAKQEVSQKPNKRSQTFHCNECASVFRTKRVLENHMRCKHESNNKRKYTCTVCDKTFKTDANLYTHRKIHETANCHRCTYCNKSFRLKHHLHGHEIQHQTLPETARIQCKRCCKTFATTDHLRKHAKIHLLNDCKCHICGAKMKQKRYLQRHMLKVHLQRISTK